MTRTTPFSLVFDPEVKRHLRFIEVKHHALIRAGTEEQLRFEPEVETRNRKPLRLPAPLGAAWELRLGPDNRFRILYTVASELREVRILAIGVKKGNRLNIGGEDVSS